MELKVDALDHPSLLREQKKKSKKTSNNQYQQEEDQEDQQPLPEAHPVNDGQITLWISYSPKAYMNHIIMAKWIERHLQTTHHINRSGSTQQHPLHGQHGLA